MIGFLKTKIINRLRMQRFHKQFREKNKHNFTFPASIFLLENVSIGKYSYGAIDVLDYDNARAKVEIGSFCSIASGVKLLSGGGITYIIFQLIHSMPILVRLKRRILLKDLLA